MSVSANAWYDIEAGYDFLYAEWRTPGGELAAHRQRGRRLVERPVDDAALLVRRRRRGDGVPVPVPDRRRRAPARRLPRRHHRSTATVDDVESGAGAWTATGLWTDQHRHGERRRRRRTTWSRTGSTRATTTPCAPGRTSSARPTPVRTGSSSSSSRTACWSGTSNHSVEDNNTSQHPGAGLSLPVDARPAKFTYPDGIGAEQPAPAVGRDLRTARPRDATCLHKQVVAGKGQSQTIETLEACAPAAPGSRPSTTATRWRTGRAGNPQNSVKVAGEGVKVTVTGDRGQDLTISVVNPAPVAQTLTPGAAPARPARAGSSRSRPSPRLRPLRRRRRARPALSAPGGDRPAAG